MQKILVLVLMSLMVVACGHQKDAKSFEKALEKSTGQKHSIAKLYTNKGDYVVFKNDVTGEYVAYNMDKWNRDKMTTVDQYLAVAVEGKDIVGNLAQSRELVEAGHWASDYDTYYETYTYYDEDCECTMTATEEYEVYVGEYWVDESYMETFYTGGGFRFDNTSGISKDLDTVAALQEEVAQKFMSHKLKSEFSLSDKRSDELAKLAGRYQKLESSRELTETEKDKFAMEALGVSLSQVEAALKQKAEGKEARYADLLETAAQVNKTTPEQIGKFFEEMIADGI